MVKNKKILFIQRVITGYRLNLLKLLSSEFLEVGFLSSKGDKEGTLKLADFQSTEKEHTNINFHILPALKINYKGESRGTSLFLYPKALSIISAYDIIVFEGTTNLINNLYLIPYAKCLKKKTIWWDAGYSLPNRSFKRKIIDTIVKPFLKMTDAQMVYSTLAKKYLEQYMGAKNVFLNLNTINTSYFDTIVTEIKENNKSYMFDITNIRLLYVGVVEKRKKIKELIDIVLQLNNELKDKSFQLSIIGGGNQLKELKDFTKKEQVIQILGPIYDKDKLKNYYFNHDLFVLPGDGGLAILQALLYGLPVLSIKGADGTELDYITNKKYLATDLSEIKLFLKKLKSINRIDFIEDTPKLSAKNWVNKLTRKISTLN